MSKYHVILKEIEIYTIEVDAETEEEACDIAWDLLTDSEENKAQYHDDSDGLSEAFKV